MIPPERRLIIETNAANMLRQSLLEITDDEETIRDTIEGETNLQSAIQEALGSLMEDEILEAGIEHTLKALQARLNRVQFKVEKKRAAILRAMEAGELKKVILPEATLSLRQVPRGLEIQDLRKIPKRYFEEQEPRLNKAALKQDLKDGKSVDGAILDNGSITLSIKKG